MIQYNNSPALNNLNNGLLAAFATNPVYSIDPITGLPVSRPQTYQQFCNDYLNISSATTDGLDNWGRILNFGRSVEILDYKGIFGLLNEGLTPPTNTNDYPQNFGFGTFFNEQAAKNNRINLDDNTYRFALRFIYLKTLSDGSTNIINRCFELYFQNRDVLAFVKVTAVNTYEYTFYGTLTQGEKFMFGTANNYKLLATPMGHKESCVYL